MELPTHERTARPGRARTAWLAGGLVLGLLLAAVLWEGKPWESFSTSLVDSRWKIETVQGAPMRAGYFVPFLQFLPHTTIFGTDKFLGEDSCNSLQGTYAITGDQVTFTDIATSLVGCPEGVDVIGALGETRSWRKDGNRLHLYDAKGAVTIELIWNRTVGYDLQAPAPTPTRDPSAGPVVDSSRMAVESPSATNT